MVLSFSLIMPEHATKYHIVAVLFLIAPIHPSLRCFLCGALRIPADLFDWLLCLAVTNANPYCNGHLFIHLPIRVAIQLLNTDNQYQTT